MRRDRVRDTPKDCNEIRKQKIRILLVDDHPSVLSGIRSYLRSRENLRIVGQSSDGLDAVQKVATLHPDIVILDLSLPKLSGMEVIRKIRPLVPESKLIAYTMHESKEFAREALSAGASGYVLKSAPLGVLVEAVITVQAGGKFFDATLHESFRRPFPADDSPTNKTTEDRDINVSHCVESAAEYIEKHLSPSLRIKEIASALGKHPTDLDRMFARGKGLSIKRHIDKLCKAEVLNRLRRGETKGSQIALELGFRDDQSFYRWVRRVFGVRFKELQQFDISIQSNRARL